jgi:hypothetical protein
MGKNNTNNRGFSSRAKREFRMEDHLKTLNRKKNLEGCTNKKKEHNNGEYSRS